MFASPILGQGRGKEPPISCCSPPDGEMAQTPAAEGPRGGHGAAMATVSLHLSWAAPTKTGSPECQNREPFSLPCMGNMSHLGLLVSSWVQETSTVVTSTSRWSAESGCNAEGPFLKSFQGITLLKHQESLNFLRASEGFPLGPPSTLGTTTHGTVSHRGRGSKKAGHDHQNDFAH